MSQLIKTLKPINSQKQINPPLQVRKKTISVNPSKYVSDYNKGVLNKGLSNKGMNKMNEKKDVNILLIILIILFIVGVVLIILHFEYDIFKLKKNKNTTNTSTTSNTQSSNIPNIVQEEEVYYVEDDNLGNKFKREEAKKVCESLDSKLATYADLLKATNNGAKWCSYGWILDKNNNIDGYMPNKDDMCSKEDLNKPIAGPYQDKNIDIDLLGVNCYGKKPGIDKDFRDILIAEKEKEAEEEKLKHTLQKQFDNRVRLSNIAPFNENRWSNNLPNEHYFSDKTCDKSKEKC